MVEVARDLRFDCAADNVVELIPLLQHLTRVVARIPSAAFELDVEPTSCKELMADPNSSRARGHCGPGAGCTQVSASATARGRSRQSERFIVRS